jgi:hypothetical protein
MSINIIFNAHFCKVKALLIELLIFYIPVSTSLTARDPPQSQGLIILDRFVCSP